MENFYGALVVGFWNCFLCELIFIGQPCVDEKIFWENMNLCAGFVYEEYYPIRSRRMRLGRVGDHCCQSRVEHWPPGDASPLSAFAQGGKA
ncbi:hypothetical protein XFF6990_140195 [Xanthomonas citri pv. fuscans]|nr:hypothetical protein XFF6990_140195 [Xanthomonas citri pv. fuscans]